MVNDLVRNAPVVLQNVEVLGTASLSDFLRDGLLYNFISFHSPSRIPGTLWSGKDPGRRAMDVDRRSKFTM
jgi:hypothetical protein